MKTALSIYLSIYLGELSILKLEKHFVQAEQLTEPFNFKSIVYSQKGETNETSFLEVTFAAGIGKLQRSLTVSLLPKFGASKNVVVNL